MYATNADARGDRQEEPVLHREHDMELDAVAEIGRQGRHLPVERLRRRRALRVGETFHVGDQLNAGRIATVSTMPSTSTRRARKLSSTHSARAGRPTRQTTARIGGTSGVCEAGLLIGSDSYGRVREIRGCREVTSAVFPRRKSDVRARLRLLVVTTN